jgi:predicted phage terminase large subunit-like protein
MTREIRPNPGPQSDFLANAADLTIFGGAAGGGKTWALLLEPLRHVTTNPAFAAVCFRRTTVQIRNPGGLWDQSMRLYPLIGGIPAGQPLEWRWKNGGKIKFAHLEHENNKLDWHGSEIPLLLFDELTHFTATQFWYLLSRNRSMSGVAGYVRASCNADADSWVAQLIAWWIDQTTGLPIRERCGMLRWFIRISDEMIWADDPDTLRRDYPGSLPKSLTFIAATLDDNPALNAVDPGYRANLMALQRVERERLLGGNWLIRASAGNFFQAGWCEFIDAAPAGMTEVRGWDLAGTRDDGTNDPDWTTGTRMGRTPDGRYVVLDHVWMRGTPGQVERLIYNTATQDGKKVAISLPKDPGQAGVAQVLALTKMLAGWIVKSSPESGDKETRFSPFSAQAEAGNVLVLRGPWNQRWIRQLEGFPEAPHDDDADSTARAFNFLAERPAVRRFSDAALLRAAQRRDGGPVVSRPF